MIVIIFSCEAPLLLELEELFRRDFGVLLPKTEEELTEDGMEVLLRARDLAELKLAEREELLKFGVLGATVTGVLSTGASELERSFSSAY